MGMGGNGNQKPIPEHLYYGFDNAVGFFVLTESHVLAERRRREKKQNNVKKQNAERREL